MSKRLQNPSTDVEDGRFLHSGLWGALQALEPQPALPPSFTLCFGTTQRLTESMATISRKIHHLPDIFLCNLLKALMKSFLRSPTGNGASIVASQHPVKYRFYQGFKERVNGTMFGFL